MAKVVVGVVVKVAGVLGCLSVAANAFSYLRFRRRNLREFSCPILDSADTLADFTERQLHDDDGQTQMLSNDDGFFFGLATAPAHVEDRLDDAWLHFAEETTPDDHPAPAPAPAPSSSDKKPLKIAMEAMIRGFHKYTQTTDSSSHSHNVAAWHNVPSPEERLRFWSDPDAELQLASQTGVSVFRMGIDWSRIMTSQPLDNPRDVINFAALERYKLIIKRVRSYGMKVMLTLFHHSLPSWAADYGGWKLEKTVDYFLDFTRVVVDSVSELVDYWVTFNEPHVFCVLTYCAGAWPGGHPDMLEAAMSTLPMGVYQQAMHWMAIAHSKAYDYIHQKSSTPNPRVGIAHHVSFMRPYGLFDIAAVMLATSITLFPFVDSVSHKLDFIGINYYGQEVVCGAGLKLVETDEYSESGRAVYPDGLYRMLLQFHERYKHLKLPFIVTENGVSDETDLIREPYLIEHLLAVYAAMRKGVPILGYLFWTISDNWEWADGYGPKFGLVAVDRANNLARTPRPSYRLFTKIVRSGKITRQDRAAAWNKLRRAAKEKKTRPFYRAVNKHGLMYAGGLDEPAQRHYVEREWRFGQYRMDGLQDPLSRVLRLILGPFMKMKTKTMNVEYYEEEDSLFLEEAQAQH